MAQYRNQMPDTLEYLERYLRTFHRKKDIFLELSTIKATHVQAEYQDHELREIIAHQKRGSGTIGSDDNCRPRIPVTRIPRANQWVHRTQRENHFNLIYLHYINHFVEHLRLFGSVPIYSTDIG